MKYALYNPRLALKELYREYQGALDDDDEGDDSQDEDDDGVEGMDADDNSFKNGSNSDQLSQLEKIRMDVSGKSYPGNPSVPDFIYGTSPGFLS